jgi:predicted nucleic acid-binding protein
MSLLVDTGGLVAYADRRDHWHMGVRRIFEIEAQRETLIVPVTVLPEVDYLVSQARAPAPRWNSSHTSHPTEICAGTSFHGPIFRE